MKRTLLFVTVAVLASVAWNADVSACGRRAGRWGCGMCCPPCYPPPWQPLYYPCVPCQPQEPETPPDEESSGRLSILLIGLTDDDRIGKSIQADVRDVEATLDAGIPSGKRYPIVRIVGQEVTEENILRQIDDLTIRSADSLLCYVATHGGYDPARASDGEGGHRLLMTDGSLMWRKTLYERLTSKGAKLTVLLTDSCNTKAPAQAAATYGAPPTFSNAVLVSLFLRQEGVVDVNAAKTDQCAWFSGGPQDSVFTGALVRLWRTPSAFPAPSAVTWREYLDAVSDETNKTYLSWKKSAGNAAKKEMLDQAEQRPQEFHVQTGRLSLDGSGAARVVVRLPADTRLYVDGGLTPEAAPVRVLWTPRLEKGKEYVYTFRAEVDRDGTTYEERRRVFVRAGRISRIDFGDMSTATAVGPAKRPPYEVVRRSPEK